jgi:hypothetical protein
MARSASASASKKSKGLGRELTSTVEVAAYDPVGFANSGGLVFVDESAEEIPTL